MKPGDESKDSSNDEDVINDGQCDEQLVEGFFELFPSPDQDRKRVP